MSFHRPTPGFSRRFRLILASFLQHPGLPFADTLSEATIQQAFDEQDASFADDEDAVYTPAITLWAFLSQVLFKGEQRSCVAAVARVVLLLLALERGPCSTNTGAYCRARGKMSETVLERLTLEVAKAGENQAEKEWLWQGRHVHLVDGTTVSMPDTPENQAAYPQAATQPKGVGFPVARMVVLLSLATGMLSGMAMGPYRGKETGETALLRELLGKLQEGDILLADRYFCSYFMIALLRASVIDFVTRIHQRRSVDFRRGRRLGRDDQIVRWMRPAKPKWMDQRTYDQMPPSIEVRQLRVRIHQPGYRPDAIVVVTTLTDAKAYSRDDIAELYHQRGMAELDIRALKSTLGMDVLRCKTPEMVRKEIWTGLLAYNLIRQIMAQSALGSPTRLTDGSGICPRQLSFSAALQCIGANWMVMLLSDDELAVHLIEVTWENLRGQLVGNRPGRTEPRAVKRRPKPHKLLTKPRAEARAELLTLKPEKSS